ncbi:MAG: hypothetical protein J6Y77_00310, partial [Paludibacteraceae bacterium]|nr:hypothetical protein [Paludibacteraceae bacterium]
MKTKALLFAFWFMSLTAPVWAINFTSIRQVSDTLYMGKDTLLAIDNLLSKVCYEGASDDLLFDSYPLNRILLLRKLISDM